VKVVLVGKIADRWFRIWNQYLFITSDFQDIACSTTKQFGFFEKKVTFAKYGKRFGIIVLQQCYFVSTRIFLGSKRLKSSKSSIPFILTKTTAGWCGRSGAASFSTQYHSNVAYKVCLSMTYKWKPWPAVQHLLNEGYFAKKH